MNTLFVLLRKDLRCLLRDKHGFRAALGFSLMLVAVLAASGLEAFVSGKAGGLGGASGVWLAFLFIGISVLSASFLAEEENQALLGLLALGVDPLWVFFSKWAVTSLLLFFLQLLVFGGVGLLTEPALLEHFGDFAALTLLGVLAFGSLGTLAASICACVRSREVVLSIVMLPFLLPLFFALLALSAQVLAGRSFWDGSPWFSFLCAYDILCVVLSSVLFEYLIKE